MLSEFGSSARRKKTILQLVPPTGEKGVNTMGIFARRSSLRHCQEGTQKRRNRPWATLNQSEFRAGHMPRLYLFKCHCISIACFSLKAIRTFVSSFTETKNEEMSAFRRLQKKSEKGESLIASFPSSSSSFCEPATSATITTTAAPTTTASGGGMSKAGGARGKGA